MEFHVSIGHLGVLFCKETFKFFAHSLIGCLVFFLLICKSSLYILNIVLHVQVVQISSVIYIFIFLIVYFDK